MACNSCTSAIVLLALFMCVMASNGGEAETLIEFKRSLSNTTALNSWDPSVPVCNGSTAIWNGLLCSKGNVYGLQLEGMGLTGFIDFDILANLTYLRTLSFMNNNFNSPFPNRINELGPLRGLFLSNNRFNGEIPDDAFSGMSSLRRVYLANNQLSGKIPKSLVDIPKLVELQIENNQFEGLIPDFQQKDLVVNMANNKLEGPIPAALGGQSSSLFGGNLNLCGAPLGLCKSYKKKKKPIIPKVAVIIIGAGVVALAAIIAATLVFRRRRRRPPPKFGKPQAAKLYQKDTVANNYKADRPNHVHKYKKNEQGKLYFVRKDREMFELQDLLRASAEVLGSGSFGSSYKAVLLSGPIMVVKRFRQMSNVRKEDFYEHMRRLGSLSHPNLLPLVAFYYKKEEKLFITEFTENGSLASLLHGKRRPNQGGLDWPTRLRIIKGVAKGLAYLYKEFPSLTLYHGHLKSSNVLLDDTFEPLLADYALVPVMNKEHAQQFMVAYKAPENDRMTKKTDVWCLGILILEMLTGKFPANYLKQGKGGNADLAAWVNSVVREEWTGEVFDKDMKETKNGEGEMLKLLKIGMCCCEWNVERRWDLREALDKIEELKERDSDEDCSSSASEGEMYSSRAMTEDEFSFSVTA